MGNATSALVDKDFASIFSQKTPKKQDTARSLPELCTAKTT